jgi:flagellar protein FlbT
VPILREKDIMKEEDASTPCKRIYFAVQLMYVDEANLVIHHHTYWKLVHELVNAVPSALGLIDQLSEQILGGKYYKALKIAKKLIDYEHEIMKTALGNLDDAAKKRIIEQAKREALEEIRKVDDAAEKDNEQR